MVFDFSAKLARIEQRKQWQRNETVFLLNEPLHCKPQLLFMGPLSF
jgi:hypothetical protein